MLWPNEQLICNLNNVLQKVRPTTRADTEGWLWFLQLPNWHGWSRNTQVYIKEPMFGKHIFNPHNPTLLLINTFSPNKQ